MNILLFTEHVGASSFWGDVIDALGSRGVDVVFATLRQQEHVHARAGDVGIPAYALGAKSARAYPVAAARLLGILRAHRVDVLHVCEAIPAAVAGLIPRSPSGSRRIFDWGGSALGDGVERLLFRFAERRADLLLACSEATAAVARSDGRARAHRIRVAYRGVREPHDVPPAELRRLRGELGIPGEAAVISVLAHLRPEKAIDMLIAALPQVERSLKRPVSLIVAGDGPEAPRLRAMAANLATQQIIFAGEVRDISPWLRIADVVALPSLREGFPKSAVEAVACRRPVVATSVGGVPELIEHNETGILAPPSNVAALARALSEILAAPEKAARMADAAYRVYRQRFTTEAMVDRWLGVYRDGWGET
ncbi:MAG: glycosyltransferase family 4 protein [Acidimicrobiales bacterium]